MIVSFDIFDTVLTRLVGKPDSLFLLLGERLSEQDSTVSPEIFARNRVIAEKLARQNHPQAEPTLTCIYEAFAWLMGWDQDHARMVRAQELVLEAEQMCAVPGARKLIEELTAKALSTVFISDMYLPSAFLQEQLAKLLALPSPPEVMVSCEWGASKASGELFRCLLREKSVKPSDVLHVGNDSHSDGVVPAGIGIRTKLLDQANLNRYETSLEEHRYQTGGFSSRLAGASRLARLTVPVKDSREAVIRDVAAGVAAPLLVSYVLWVLSRAEQLGLKRLYFVSRDGEILLEIASRLISKLGLRIELRYLYGSRQAWHLPAFGKVNRLDEDWMLDNFERLSIEVVLQKVNLAPSDIEDVLLASGFPRDTWSADLDSNGRRSFAAVISNATVRSRIIQKAEEAQEIMLGYLQDEGLADDVPIGLVDLGWTGRMLDSLWAVLKPHRMSVPTGFLFGLCNRTDEMPKEAYAMDAATGQGDRELFGRGTAQLLELFCSGTHGTVLGYERRNGSSKPTLKKPINEEVVAWGLGVFRKTIYSFLDGLVITKADAAAAMRSRPAICAPFLLLRDHPSRPEAEVIGSYRHSTVQTEQYSLPLASPYLFRDIVRRFLRMSERRYLFVWISASMELTTPAVRWGLRGVVLAERIGAKLSRTARRFAPFGVAPILTQRSGKDYGRHVPRDRPHSPDMKLSHPSVSVIIPTYNRGEVLCQTVTMALAQDYPDFEVIVVDQTSEPPEMVREFFKTAVERLRYIKRKIPNLPAARNAGVRLARGEIIVFIDDDVIIGPEYVAAHVRAYRDTSVGAVKGLTLPPSNRDEAEVLRQHIVDTLQSLPEGCFLVKRVLGCNCSFRKQAIIDAGMFDESFTGSGWCEEIDLSLRVDHMGRRLIFDPRVRLVHLALKSGGCENRDERNQRVRDEHCKLGLYLNIKNRAIIGSVPTLSQIWRDYRFYAFNRAMLRSPLAFARSQYKFASNLLSAGRMCLKGPMVSEPDNAL